MTFQKRVDELISLVILQDGPKINPIELSDLEEFGTYKGSVV